MLSDSRFDALSARLNFIHHRAAEEFEEYPALLMDVAESAAAALNERDMASSREKRVLAQAAKTLRDGPVKMSEAAITSESVLDPAYIAAQEAGDQARWQAGRWGALFEAMRAKGSSMKRYGELITAGFLAPSAAYKDNKAEMASARSGRVKVGAG